MPHKYSTRYLDAIANYLGAETFGLTTERREGAKLIAQLAGPAVETEWLRLRAEICFGQAGELIRSTRDEWLPTATRISAARALSAREPAPTGRDPLTDLARAELALDHALSALPIPLRRQAGELMAKLGELIRDLGGLEAHAAEQPEAGAAALMAAGGAG